MKVTCVRLVSDPDTALACAYREPWIGPHPLCEVMVAQMCADFDSAVARGDLDAHGYATKDRVAVQRRKEEIVW